MTDRSACGGEPDNADAPEISVIIVNYNGRRWLDGCLTALLADARDDVEVVVVDNASSDGSPAFARRAGDSSRC